jgi:hypothetical protein
MKLQLFCLSLWAVTARIDGADNLRIDGGTESGWESNKWSVVVDGVMGGQSSGSITFQNSNSVMAFSGDIILDGGGFSSVRRSFGTPIDLTSYEGIVVELETTPNNVFSNSNDVDNAPLGLHLQLHDRSSYYGYASAFAISKVESPGMQTSVYLPLESFDRGTRMGFQCRNNCKLDASKIDEIDIYVLFQRGQFEVKVRSITAVKAATTFASPTISLSSSTDIRNLLESTIRSGSYLYNYGYAELCIAIYSSTLNSLLAASITDGNDELSQETVSLLKGMACEGILLSDSQEKASAAFTLRYTMDGILEQLGFIDPEGANIGSWRPNVATATAFADQCQARTSSYGVSAPINQSPSPTDKTQGTPTPMPSSKPTVSAPKSSPRPSIQISDPSSQTSVPTTSITESSAVEPTNSVNLNSSNMSENGNEDTIFIGVGVAICATLLAAVYYIRYKRSQKSGIQGAKELPPDSIVSESLRSEEMLAKNEMTATATPTSSMEMI